jgi:hypothetical protein
MERREQIVRRAQQRSVLRRPDCVTWRITLSLIRYELIANGVALSTDLAPDPIRLRRLEASGCMRAHSTVGRNSQRVARTRAR